MGPINIDVRGGLILAAILAAILGAVAWELLSLFFSHVSITWN